MSPASTQGAEHHPSCLRCAHYHVTWDPQAPHGCRAMGFKSRYLPHVHVQRTSGLACQMFRPRPPRRR